MITGNPHYCIGMRERDAALAACEERCKRLVIANENAEKGFVNQLEHQREMVAALTAKLDAAWAALKPFDHFAKQFDAMPLGRIDNVFYTIRTGTEWEAELKVTDMKRALDAVRLIDAAHDAAREGE